MSKKNFEYYLMKGLEDALFEGEQDKEIITWETSPLEVPNGYKQGFYLGLKFYRKWGENKKGEIG
jgi:hypothetical protein